MEVVNLHNEEQMDEYKKGISLKRLRNDSEIEGCMDLTPKISFLAQRAGVYYAREALGSALDSFGQIKSEGPDSCKFRPRKVASIHTLATQ